MAKKDKRPEWLRKLDDVDMTIAQSRQVKRRNQGLLDELARVEVELLDMKVPKGWAVPDYTSTTGQAGSSYSTVGCPHCSQRMGVWRCNACAWALYEKRQTGMQCLDAEFDGVCLREVAEQAPLLLWHGARKEGFKVYFCDPITRQDMVECIALIRKFLNAHITWAEDNIRRRREKK